MQLQHCLSPWSLLENIKSKDSVILISQLKRASLKRNQQSTSWLLVGIEHWSCVGNIYLLSSFRQSKCQSYFAQLEVVVLYTRVGRKVHWLTLYLLLKNFFDHCDPSTATLMEEVCVLLEELSWKINLIWSYSMRVSWSAYELFSYPLYSDYAKK